MTDLNLRSPGRVGYLIVSLSTAALVCRLLTPATGRAGRLMRSAFSWRPVAAIGLASYSLYLRHPVIIAIAKRNLRIDTVSKDVIAAPGIVLTIIAATWISYRYSEKPFNRLKNRWVPDTGPGLVEVRSESQAETADVDKALVPM